jgi:hypothetical protein
VNTDIDDGLDWLREIRKKIANQCRNDPKIMGDYFRQIQKQYQDQIQNNSSNRQKKLIRFDSYTPVKLTADSC